LSRTTSKLDRVSPSLTPIEVWRGRTNGDEADVHIHGPIDADDVAQQTPVPIDAVGRGLREKTDAGTGGKQPFRVLRRGTPVALGAEEDLGGVDLHEPHPLPIAKRNRIPVDHMVNAIDRRNGPRLSAKRAEEDKHESNRNRLHGDSKFNVLRQLGKPLSNALIAGVLRQDPLKVLSGLRLLALPEVVGGSFGER
jgi:hypothetical protein